MDLQNLLPQQSHPIHRATAGHLPTDLAELSEIQLSYSSPVLPMLPSGDDVTGLYCSYEGGGAE
uniref:Uncharacterized protein n=1 Tax=Cyanothece sp. (strain PCC 7425 / ATCC 29141) TaxID=395961 RepID=B8HTY3_CYAP4